MTEIRDQAMEVFEESEIEKNDKEHELIERAIKMKTDAFQAFIKSLKVRCEDQQAKQNAQPV